MLNIIMSPPGTGKTTYITEQIKACNDGLSFGASGLPILIVPEQSHFETERMIYKKLGARMFCNTEILSFTKLGAKILADNKTDKPYAEDAVREILMLKTVRELRDKLAFYRQTSREGGAASPAFAARMLNVVAAFGREGISPEQLSEAVQAIKNPRLKSKISDAALIYGEYIRAVSENHCDRQDEIRLAAALAFKTRYFAGKHIFVDGFDGFTGGQMLLLEAAAIQAAGLTVTLTGDRMGTTDARYIITSRLAEKLKKIAEDNKTGFTAGIPEPYIPERNPRHNTEVYKLSDIYTESNFVAAKIRELITTQNYSQSEIAVLNPPSMGVLESAFSAYGIKLFSDIPVSVIEKPMVRFIITVLEVIESGITAEAAADNSASAIEGLIESGFLRVSADIVPIRDIKVVGQRKISGKRTHDYIRYNRRTQRLSKKQIQLLTQTAREWKLGYEDWYRTFPAGVIEEKNTEKAERIRAEITDKLAALANKIKDTTGDVITKELTAFILNDMEFGRTVADIVYKGRRAGVSLDDEYRGLWEKIIGVFESMYGALENQKISVSDYKAVLCSVFEKTLTAKPPQVLDCVIVGDLRRTRTGNVKVVFLMGVNRGEFPSSTFSGVQFTESEVEQMHEAGIFIEENRADRYYRERFLINRAMSLPTEKLYITAPLRDLTWKEKRASALISEPILKDKHKDAKALPLSFWASHKNALKFLTAVKPAEAALVNALSEIEPKEHLRLFTYKNIENRGYLHRIDSTDARALLERESISPSRIETLNTCLFKYFCEQGLKIGTRRIKNNTEPDALTRGSATHFVLEKTLEEWGGKNDNYESFINADSDEFLKITERYITEFEENEFHGLARSARKQEILFAHATGIAEVLKQMREDMESSDFRPFEIEKKFEFMHGDILIKGKTDRIDILQNGESRYIRVIDYKTGSKEFNPSEIEYGLNMQALIYLFAAVDSDARFKPAGAFYRLVNGGRLSESCRPYGASVGTGNTADLYQNRLETQKTTGLGFGTPSPDIEEINKKFKQRTASRKEFIKLINLEDDEFSNLFRKTAEQLKTRLNALYEGDMRAVPTYSGSSPCEYCDYKGICNNAGKYEEIKIK
ncbi:MAG: PD-(D/E)XK nuclease family protein [Oscillospiraceae bacterium]|nr:PD-(D/E)XK nuclease family protein [Oscillospiraceae bacterium]